LRLLTHGGLIPLSLTSSAAAAKGTDSSPGSPGTSPAVLIPHPLALALLGGDTTWLVPWSLRAFVAAVVLGPALMLGLRVRRRPAVLAATAEPGVDGVDTPGATDAGAPVAPVGGAES